MNIWTDENCRPGLGRDSEFDLSREECLRELEGVRSRVVRWDLSPEEGLIQIEFRGKWFHLIRTDWADDVGTWRGMTFEEATEKRQEVVDNLIASCWRGARVGVDTFAIVDRVSDG